MKGLKWLVFILAIMLTSALIIGIYSRSQASNNKENVSESGTLTMPTLTASKRGLTILSDCAKTACVAAKAAEYKAQVEAERQTQLAVQAEADRQALAAMYQPTEVPLYLRPSITTGPCAGYSSEWTCGQARWAAMSESEKIEEARKNGGTYGTPQQKVNDQVQHARK